MNIVAKTILNTFQNSDKQHLLITGRQRSGKSSLFNEIKAMICKDSPILTSYKKDDCVYMSDGCHIDKIGIKDEKNLYYGQPMQLIKDGFYNVGIPFIQKEIKSQKWICIDEIGFLESEEIEFQNAIKEAMNQTSVLAVVRKQDINFLNELKNREDVYVVDMDSLASRFGCIIMASGKSQRYGSNKLFETYKGKTFIEHALDISDDLFYHRVVITRDLVVKALCEKRGVEVHVHDYPFRNQAIELGMRYMNDVDNCMFVPCDQPLLSKESLVALLEKSINHQGIIRLGCKGNVGSPVLFHQQFFKELAMLPKKEGGRYVIKRHLDCLEVVECENEWELFDIDTKDDFNKINEL